VGGSTADGFVTFEGASVVNATQSANGLTGGPSLKPYLNDASYNPNITFNVRGDGVAWFTFWLGQRSLWKSYSGSIGSAKRDIKTIKIITNCDNGDRTICIDDLSIWSTYYSNDYESANTDWTTATSGRYTPVILEEKGNHYLSVKQDERYNNGTTLSSASLGVPAGTSYQMTFDLKL
jgi:hypothetical protein